MDEEQQIKIMKDDVIVSNKEPSLDLCSWQQTLEETKNQIRGLKMALYINTLVYNEACRMIEKITPSKKDEVSS